MESKGFPAFGFLLILVGLFLLVNTFNGNLIDFVQGKLQLNFTPSASSSNNSSAPNTIPSQIQNNPVSQFGRGQ